MSQVAATRGCFSGKAATPDAEVAERLDQRGPARRRSADALGVLLPLAPRVAGRVAAQRQHVAHARRRRTAPMTCRSSAREWPTQVRWPTGVRVVSVAIRSVIADGAVAGRAAGAVGDRDEGRPQRLELAQRLPELPLALVGLGREELEGERPAARRRAARATGRAGIALRGHASTDRRGGSWPPSATGGRAGPAHRPADATAPYARTAWTPPHPLDAEDLRSRVAEGASTTSSRARPSVLDDVERRPRAR